MIIQGFMRNIYGNKAFKARRQRASTTQFFFHISDVPLFCRLYFVDFFVTYPHSCLGRSREGGSKRERDSS